MGQHVRAALGPAGRVALVELVNSGSTFRQAAACLNVAPATAHRWWWRWRAASSAERVGALGVRSLLAAASMGRAGPMPLPRAPRRPRPPIGYGRGPATSLEGVSAVARAREVVVQIDGD